MLRGRVTAPNSRQAGDFDPQNGAAWVLRGDRALTWASVPPAGTEIIAGEWWPASYRGTPLVSMSEEEARELGVWVGDSIAFNVLGRKFEATITSIRHVEVGELRAEFCFHSAGNAGGGATQLDGDNTCE